MFSLLDVFDAARDLYNTVRNKEKRDYEKSLRLRGYPESKIGEELEDYELGNNEDIDMDKAAVTREFERGLDDVGTPFSIGDGMGTRCQRN